MSNRMDPRRTLAAYFVAGALMTAATGLSVDIYLLMLCFGLFMGLTVGAAQVGLYPFATQIYPTAVRVTGVGWAQAWGRIGSILGPLAGGYLVARGFGFTPDYLFGAAPLLVCAVAIFAMRDTTPAVAPAPDAQTEAA